MASSLALPLPPASSPLSSPPPSQSFSRQDLGSNKASDYRPPMNLPFELAQHVQTYYEESLFAQAFNFLLSITGNGVSSINRQAPVMIPPPSHLALAVTLAVHPIFTTRTTSREKWDQANAARRLLRLVHATVGPVNADFATAFSFRKYDFRSSRHSGNRLEYEDGDFGADDHFSSEHDLNTPFAGSQALWVRAEDFWHVVGWSFNCACLTGTHTARWNYYSLLLEFMVDVLETDWRVRTTPEESLIWQYIELAAGGHARARRIVRAIFADGSTRSTREFRAIFPHELEEPEDENGQIKKREVDVNIDQDIYGDYMAHDESDFSDDFDVTGASASVGAAPNGRPWKRPRTRTRTPSSRRLTPQSSAGSLRSDHETGEDVAAASLATKLADPTSLDLRLRLMRLLIHVSSHPTLTSTSPTTFPDLEDLFTLFVEFTKPLPLPVFARIVLPCTASQWASPLADRLQSGSVQAQAQAQIFEPQTLALFCESLLQRILENSSPSIRSHVLLSQSKLEIEYLPFAAGRNTVDANARVSLLLESLTRCLGQLSVLKKTPALTDAVNKGVQKRLGRIAELGDGKRSKKAQKGEEQDIAWAWLVESGKRITKVVDALQDSRSQD
ncbi:hypothetical protein A1O3_09020 [Capronia epimyces CBS 606.96]|uniref:Uncharacterized protein n=1 Tax=Capronia epimyces CBS 606.96 TaxID=1182542 RepID=W9XLN5_9EURO|nr:uncharacterized protein A1O3_09020 [Capronia epimyces CBS 606.96]EXJ77861.1 hypothetical protein A1O3_09020 [Capronia epimyces CBS 606.96]